MPKTEQVVLTNMCMVTDGTKFLVQERKKTDWPGIVYPGGHIEAVESLHETVIREIVEETSLTIANPQLVGVKHFHTRDDGIRYLVFLYRTAEFTGEIRSSEEGEVVWVSREDIASGRVELADSMEDLLSFYFEENVSELYYERDEEGILQRIFF